MTPESILIPELREKYQQDSLAMRETFERTSDGVAGIHRRTTIVDGIVRRLWTDLAEEPGRIAVVATGGFGRKELFPSSDIDILYLCADEEVEQQARDSIRACSQAMWDIGLRASPATRTLRECDRFDPENIEFTLIASGPPILDRRLPSLQKASRQSHTGPGSAGVESSGTKAGGDRAQPSHEIRQHHLPPRTQH